MKKDPAFAQSEAYKVMESNWLKAFVEDARALIVYAQKRFPQAQIYLLGHSQGTYVGLMAAHLNETVKGVALVGYCPVSADTIVFEQVVYRSLRTFRELDADRDGMLEPEESAAAKVYPMPARPVGVIDGDKDGRISEPEFMAGQYANWSITICGPALAAAGSGISDANQVLKEAGFKGRFFPGLLDNQTLIIHPGRANHRRVDLEEGNAFVYYPASVTA
jgi:pimeloyl-ACP methyl ester carboxylesterase